MKTLIAPASLADWCRRFTPLAAPDAPDGAMLDIGFQNLSRLLASGKPIRVKSWRGHHLEIKSQRRIRRYAGKAVLGNTHANQITRLLPYGG